jgi:CRP-like cAMP-binding protein
VPTVAEVLTKVPLFSGLDRKAMRELESAVREVTFEAGAVVTESGQMGIGFFVVAGGELIVKVGGHEVRRLGPGDYFGEMALIDREFRSADVVAASEATCLGFTAWDFRPFAMAHPDVAWALLETMVKRVRQSEERRSQ